MVCKKKGFAVVITEQYAGDPSGHFHVIKLDIDGDELGWKTAYPWHWASGLVASMNAAGRKARIERCTKTTGVRLYDSTGAHTDV